jgi:hypothetical protein
MELGVLQPNALNLSSDIRFPCDAKNMTPTERLAAKSGFGERGR